MINTNLEVEIFIKVFDALVVTSYILLKLDGIIISIVSFNHIWKRIGHLTFWSNNPSNQACTTNIDRIDTSKLCVFKALFHKRFDVKLEIHPHTFHYHTTGYTCMQGKSVNVVLAICVELGTVENESPSFLFLILKCNFEMETLFVHHFALKYNIWLDKSEFFSVFPWYFPFRLYISHISIPLDRFIICFLQRSLSQPRFNAVFFLDIK